MSISCQSFHVISFTLAPTHGLERHLYKVTALKLISIFDYWVGSHIIFSLSYCLPTRSLTTKDVSEPKALLDLYLTSFLDRRAMAWLSIITQIIWPSSSIFSSDIISFAHLLCNLLPWPSSTRHVFMSRDISQALNLTSTFNNSHGHKSLSRMSSLPYYIGYIYYIANTSISQFKLVLYMSNLYFEEKTHINTEITVYHHNNPCWPHLGPFVLHFFLFSVNSTVYLFV